MLETQMAQNEVDHQTILTEVRHNCAENSKRFDKLEELITTAAESKANKWVEWFAKSLIAAMLTIAVYMLNRL